MFDLFTGKQVGEGKTSLAYNIAFQANERTLTDEEVDAIIVNILNQLKTELGAELRS
jgi:phenylalanyl-tRNA synthetase beta chain